MFELLPQFYKFLIITLSWLRDLPIDVIWAKLSSSVMNLRNLSAEDLRLYFKVFAEYPGFIATKRN